jgi:hypothetical protein
MEVVKFYPSDRPSNYLESLDAASLLSYPRDFSLSNLLPREEKEGLN